MIWLIEGAVLIFGGGAIIGAMVFWHVAGGV